MEIAADNAWGTHQSILKRLVEITNGPVVEMGMGDWSTPMLHELCSKGGRRLLSLESDPQWADKFKHLKGPLHEIIVIRDWRIAPIMGVKWDVAFVDNWPGKTRMQNILRLSPRARYIITHDTEPDVQSDYDYDFSQFKYRIDFKRLVPWTTIVSMTAAIPFGDE
jgi:hypothetical protein